MPESKSIKNEKDLKENIKMDVKNMIKEKRKLKIKIPKYNLFFNNHSYPDESPEIKHKEIEISI
tara:strand:+ start:489 stop:680 length:192 start_codon:yes stop_codon:yes gene_type:complete